MKPIIPASNTAYGTLNVKASGYDMTVVEHYTQHIHNLCNRLGINVQERWACLERLDRKTWNNWDCSSVIKSVTLHGRNQADKKEGFFFLLWKVQNLASFHLRSGILSLFSTCSYALPTKATEVMLMQEKGTKMYVDSILKTHERVIQVTLTCFQSPSRRPSLLRTFADLTTEPCYLSVCLAEQPEHRVVSRFHGSSSKQSTRGSSAVSERGESAWLQLCGIIKKHSLCCFDQEKNVENQTSE